MVRIDISITGFIVRSIILCFNRTVVDDTAHDIIVTHHIVVLEKAVCNIGSVLSLTISHISDNTTVNFICSYIEV